MNGLHGEVDSVGDGVMEGVGEKVDVGGEDWWQCS